MVEYIVRYTLGGDAFESTVRTSTSGAAMRWVAAQFPSAENITVIGGYVR